MWRKPSGWSAGIDERPLFEDRRSYRVGLTRAYPVGTHTSRIERSAHLACSESREITPRSCSILAMYPPLDIATLGGNRIGMVCPTHLHASDPTTA
jgi:hypothetical protein